MPVHNVATYLSEALDSVLGQTFDDLELIAIDDGSTDESPEILRARARQDPRLIVITQPNTGQGPARNRGVALARGEFLTFVDPDDVVPRDAYARMVAGLRESGSDFSVGSVVRLHNGELVDTAWVRTVHAQDRIGVTLEDFPPAMQDIICCNRMFRIEFWRKQVGGFTSRSAYEDHVPMLTAYLRAARFDVLADVTYHWRLHRASTGQQKSHIDNLLARLAVKEEAHDLIQREASKEVRDLWVGRVLEVDLRPYASIALTSDAAYRELVSAAYRTFLDRASERALGQVRVINKVRAELAARGRWPDLAQAEDWFAADPALLPPTQVVDGRVVAVPPSGVSCLDGLPSATFETSPLETHFQGVLCGVQWAGDRVVLTGWSVIRGLGARGPVQHRAWLESPGQRIELDVSTTTDPRANLWSRQVFCDYSGAGFTMTLPLAELPSHTTDWAVVISTTQEGITSSGPLEFRMPESTAMVPHTGVAELAGAPAAISVTWTRTHGCLVRVVADPVSVLELSTHEERFVSGALSRPVRDLVLRGRRQTLAVDVTSTPDGSVTFSTHLPEPGTWFLESPTAELWWGGGSPGVRRTREGGLELRVGVPRVEVAGVHLDAEALSLVVELDHDGMSAQQLAGIRLHNNRTTLAPVRTQEGPRSASLTWKLTESEFGLPLHQIPSQVLWLRRDGDPRRLAATRALRSEMPFWQTGSSLDLKVGQTREEALKLTVQPPLGWEQRGPTAQRRLREAYWANTASVGESALLQSQSGQFANDSQLALDRAIATRYPQVERVWAIRDPSTRLPPGARPVIIHSAEWYDAIATARFISNSGGFGQWFGRRPGQVYLKTMPGHPFKAMGTRLWWSQSNKHDTVERQLARVNREWATLLAPNEESADLYREHFRFGGEILVAGSPRTDALVEADAEAARRDLLTRLGVPAGTMVHLYAPTHRDVAGPPDQQEPWLEVNRLARLLGEGHVVLLRDHPNQSTHTRKASARGVIDVTRYPDVNDLILASDSIVLDYSSLRFDWALTGKPMLFFVPDLESYLASQPPVISFAEASPGPIARTTDEVAEYLNDLGAIASEHRSAISAFNARFNHLNDGRASERVLDALLDDIQA